MKVSSGFTQCGHK